MKFETTLGADYDAALLAWASGARICDIGRVLGVSETRAGQKINKIRARSPLQYELAAKLRGASLGGKKNGKPGKVAEVMFRMVGLIPGNTNRQRIEVASIDDAIAAVVAYDGEFAPAWIEAMDGTIICLASEIIRNQALDVAAKTVEAYPRGVSGFLTDAMFERAAAIRALKATTQENT